MNLLGYLVGLLGRVISPTQRLYLHTVQHNTENRRHTHPCTYWDSNPRFQCSSSWRQYMPFRPRGHWDR